jgi:AmiR/NasT family two-component response regulator
MLMAEKHLDADGAFALLVQISQRSNTKVRDVAASIIQARSGHPPTADHAISDHE